MAGDDGEYEFEYSIPYIINGRCYHSDLSDIVVGWLGLK